MVPAEMRSKRYVAERVGVLLVMPLAGLGFGASAARSVVYGAAALVLVLVADGLTLWWRASW